MPVRGRTAELQTGGNSVTQVCLERGTLVVGIHW